MKYMPFPIFTSVQPLVALAAALGAAVPAFAATPVKLNPAALTGFGVDSLTATPNSATAIYTGDPDDDGILHIYSVPIGGGSSTQITSSYVESGTLGAYLVTSDSSRIVFMGKLVDPTITELFSAPVAGGSTIQLSGTLPEFAFVRNFTLAPDGSRAIYLADQDTLGVNELYSVPVTGGPTTRLNTAFPVGRAVFDYQVTPDSSRVIYRADQDTNDMPELYSVPVGGGSPTKLNNAFLAGGNVFSGQVRVSADSSRVVFIARSSSSASYEIYSAPVDGSAAAVSLSGVLGSGFNVVGFRISPDSSRVVYLADQDTDGTFELYSVPITGGSAVKISGTMVSGGNVDTNGFEISSDSSRVVYIADQDVNSKTELYSVPILGGESPVKLNAAMGNLQDVSFFAISSNGSRVVYLADQYVDNQIEIASVPITGGTPVKLNGTLIANGDVSGFTIIPDGSSVVYLADQDVDGPLEAFQVAIDGGTPAKLNGTLVSGGTVLAVSVSPNSRYVLYRARQDVVSVSEAFSVDLQGPYGAWASSKGLTVGVNDDFGDDPNEDGLTNIEHFAFDSDPLGSGYAEGKVVTRLITSAPNKFISLTFPVRTGAIWDANGGINSTLTVDGIVYTIRGDANLQSPTDAPVDEWTPALNSGLPTLSAGYVYRTFYVTDPVSGATPKAFLQVEVTAAP